MKNGSFFSVIEIDGKDYETDEIYFDFFRCLICFIWCSGSSGRLRNRFWADMGSDRYVHLFRALQIAKAQGLEGVCGIAADSSVLYLPNNILRECLGIMKDWLMKNI